MTSIEKEILHILQLHGEIKGTARLAMMIGAKKSNVITAACLLAKNGLISIEPGRPGRGIQLTVYRRTNILQVQR